MRPRAIAGSRRRNVVTTLITETWTGTDASAWPAAWTFTQPSGTAGTNTIQGNQGVIAPGTGVYGQRVGYQSTMPTATDMNLVITVTPQTQGEGWCNVTIDSDNQPLSANGSFRQNGYTVEFTESSTAASASTKLTKQVGNVQTTLSGSIGLTFTSNTAYMLRLQRLGTTIQYRVWLASGSEPATWTASVVDGGAQPPAGRVSLMAGNADTGVPRPVAFDDLTVTSA